MDEMTRISVIVPVYKVEPYLHQCLDSIVNQTYRNLEIILVDDGSPDNCGAICDEYAARDDRIVVIHQENRGISAARNAALDIATGDYIGFVDSDDWIEPDMYEYLCTHAEAEQADIAICGLVKEYPQKSVDYVFESYMRLSRSEAMEMVVADLEIHSSVWDKLWKRELFQTVRFPVGKIYEDYAVAHLLFDRADCVCCLPEPQYHYRQRMGSIMTDIRLHSREQWMEAARARMEDLAEHWPQLQPQLEQQYLEKAIGIWSVYCWDTKEARSEILPRLREIAALVRPRRRELLRRTKQGLAGRLVLRLLPYPEWWSFALAGVIAWLYQKRHCRVL